MYLRLMTLGLYVCAFLIFNAGQAAAKDKLDKVSVEKFYKEVEKIQTAGEKKLLSFYQKHTHEAMVLVMNSIINIEGMPPQKTQDILNKEQILESALEGLEAGEIKTVEYKLVSSDISEDGKSAKTKSSVFTEMTIQVPTPEGEIPFASEAMMFCQDELMLNDKGIIQFIKGNCSNEINMKPE